MPILVAILRALFVEGLIGYVLLFTPIFVVFFGNGNGKST